jgi:hypothetical protein
MNKTAADDRRIPTCLVIRIIPNSNPAYPNMRVSEDYTRSSGRAPAPRRSRWRSPHAAAGHDTFSIP